MLDRRDIAQQRRDREYDLLKHVSTLNVAALVLFIALVEDFRPTAEVAATAPVGALTFFGVSLLLSVLGLVFTPFEETWDRVFAWLFVVPACVAFLMGMGLAVIVSFTLL